MNKKVVALLMIVSVLMLAGCKSVGPAEVTPQDAGVELDLPPAAEEILDFFEWLFAIPEVGFMMAHILLNVCVAVAAAIHDNEFKFYKLGEFLWRKLAPYILVYAGAKLVGDAAGLGVVGGSVFALIEATLLANLVENLDRLGIPLPEVVVRLVSK